MGGWVTCVAAGKAGAARKGVGWLVCPQGGLAAAAAAGVGKVKPPTFSP